MLYCKLTCGFCRSSVHLVGKVVIVTGANTGIGFETAKDFAERGARVILACRSEKLAVAACNKIIEETSNKDVHYRHLDLSSLRSVRDFAAKIYEMEKRLDILVNNAGATNLGFRFTDDGLLIGMQTNHFGPFLLTNLLLPLLKQSAPARIVNVSSIAYERGKIDLNNLNKEKHKGKSLDETQLYCDTKLCNVLMTTELSRRLQGTQVTANCLHPGVVTTEIMRDSSCFSRTIKCCMSYIGKTCYEGAQTTIYLAVSPEVQNISGKYFYDCKESKMTKHGQDLVLARQLWDKSEEFVKLK